MKLNTLLAVTDQLAPSFKQGISDTGKFFSKNQGAFKGIKKTYSALDNTIDDPSKRGVINVVTTVEEKLNWLEESSRLYIDALFSQEATNATGAARANLVVNGTDFGSMSTLELMRLKGILESQEFTNLYVNIPVREETKTWTATTDENYSLRKIFQDDLVIGDNHTTEKESYILRDPNLDGNSSRSYTPQIGVKTGIVKLGTYTSQQFTGEASHRERAEILRRLTVLKTAVVAALKQANDVEAIPSEMNSNKLFSFLHSGEI